MIEPMTHYTFLVFHQDYAAFLGRLRDVGLLHIATPVKERFPGNEEWFEMKRSSAQLEQMLDEMTLAVEGEHFTEPQDELSLETIAEEWEGWRSRYQSLERHIASLDADIKKMEPWGDFNQNSIEGLRQAGWKIGFWETQPKRWKAQWQKEYYATIIYSDKRKLYFVTFAHLDDDVELQGVEPVKILPSPTSTMIMLQTKAKDDLKKLHNQMGDYALTHGKTVEEKAKESYGKLQILRIRLSTPTICDNRVKVLTGWVPSRDNQVMENWLKGQEAVVWFTREHKEGERYPILFHHTWSHWLFMHTIHYFRLAFDRRYRNSARFMGRSKYKPFC